MIGVRASASRRAVIRLLPVLMAGLLFAAGCDEDVTDPTFPEPPVPPASIWFLGVWGSGPDDIFVVGQPGLIFHWNGTGWQQEESGTTAPLTDVWGDGAGTVYATGHGGVILRRSGGIWSPMNSGTDKNLFAIGSYENTVMAAGMKGTLRRLVGGVWQNAPELIYRRDPQQTILDTLQLSEDIESLTAVAHYGVTGSYGTVLMSDQSAPLPRADWQLRQVAAGVEWVTCAASSELVAGNFIATDGGRLFRLRIDETNRLVWAACYSPALGTRIYGVFTTTGLTDPDDPQSLEAGPAWVVTTDGRILRVDPPYLGAPSLTEVYADDLMLFDIWGTSSTNLYAVGVDGRVLRYRLVTPGEGEEEDEYAWLPEDLPLPQTKGAATHVFDKFGRPVHR